MRGRVSPQAAGRTRARRAAGRQDANGFTLIELTLVLVIIGLLAGAILVGKSMIKMSQLMGVITQIKQYQNAISLFKAKYHYLPGDMPDAESFWGTDPGGCPDTPYTATLHTATCNGDGNGIIGAKLIGDYHCNDNTEIFRFWQHLSNAGFITGSFNGIGGPNAGLCNQYALVGVNVPVASVASNAGITVYNFVGASTAYPEWYYPSKMTHGFWLGAQSPASVAAPTIFPALTGSDAASIDDKIDDGYPNTGNVLTPVPTGPRSLTGIDCTTLSPPAYIMDNVTPRCSLIFNIE
jgi:prepilin-type N-terminal cleavage/methylation domain-containing protein